MAKKLTRALALALTAVLCVGSVPAIGLAEAIENAGEQVSAQAVPKALYRTHALGAEQLDSEDETTWASYDPKATAQVTPATDEQADDQTEGQAEGKAEDEPKEPKAFDTLELKLDEEQTGIRYRVRSATSAWKDEDKTQDKGNPDSDAANEPATSDQTAEGTSGGTDTQTEGSQPAAADEASGDKEEGDDQAPADDQSPAADEGDDEWLEDGAVATVDEGVSVLQVRLSDELSERYDVWYRMRTQAEGWLGWAKNGENAGSEVSPVVDVQVTLQDKDDPAPDATDDDAEGDTKTTDGQEEQGEETDKLPAYIPAPEQDAETSQESATEQEQNKLEAQGAEAETTANLTAEQGKGDDTLTTQAEGAGVTYRAHVQREGWMNWVTDGKSGGTSGRSLRVEGIRIKLQNASGGIRYKTHVQKIGWQDWVSNGDVSGTTGRSLRLEAIVIELTGDAADQYDVYYRSHVQRLGWLQWAKNGEKSGSSGLSYRMEAIQVRLVKKGGAAPSNDDADVPMSFVGDLSVWYSANLKDGGWQGAVSNGSTAGKTGVKARVQQVSANLSFGDLGGIAYSACSDGGSWQDWTYNGGAAGTAGKNLTAVRFRLSGNVSKHYNVWYRVHIAKVGWLGWAKNGASAGSDSSAHPIEAVQVKVMATTHGKPGSTEQPYRNLKAVASGNVLHGVDISGWQSGINTSSLTADFVIVKATEGYDGVKWNPEYKTMADRALNSGKLIGFYHYANGLDAKKEARSFYDAIKSYKGRAIACLDWEGQGNGKFETGVDVAWCKTFLDELKRLYGGTPFLYTSKNVTNAYNWSSVSKSYPLWGAEYAYADVIYQGYLSNPWQSSRGWGSWGTYAKIHQYGFVNPKPNNGGYNELDADIFYGTASEWKKYQG